jgi:glycerol-3-phosphate dehydrogenase
VGSLPGSQAVDLSHDPAGAPLREEMRYGFAYADCRTDDARLTIVSARDAALCGAEIATRTEFISARRDGASWRATLRDADGESREAKVRTLVNAAGPWVLEVLRRAGLAARARLRLVKGSHIVVPRLYEGEHGYLLQNDDRRVVFVLPFEREFSLIGTTEEALTGDPAAAQITEPETQYLCRGVARWFTAAPRPGEVLWSYAGVRPLYDDRARSTTAVTRDYVFDLDVAGAPALSIFGGKLTTYRRLAEQALARLAPYLPAMGRPWTAGSVLPGGDGLPIGGIDALAVELRARHAFLDAAAAARLAASYGRDAARILAAGPGRDFGCGRNEAPLRWVVEK